VVKDFELGRRVETFLKIKQHGVLLTGTMKKRTTEPGKLPKDEDFEFSGRLREGLIYGYFEPKSGTRFGAGVLVCRVVGEGSLRGGLAFWDVYQNKILSIKDRDWERLKNDLNSCGWPLMLQCNAVACNGHLEGTL
jgi:hypothetical protein